MFHTACGMYLSSASSDIIASITGNTLNSSSDSLIAFGAYLEAGGLIGDVTGTYTYFQNNSGTIDRASSRYMLYLDTGTPGGGNYVNWTGNTFTPLNGGAASTWSGNYGTSNEVEENFGVGDTLTA